MSLSHLNTISRLNLNVQTELIDEPAVLDAPVIVGIGEAHLLRR